MLSAQWTVVGTGLSTGARHPAGFAINCTNDTG
jgi:hypothetical protein